MFVIYIYIEICTYVDVHVKGIWDYIICPGKETFYSFIFSYYNI